MDRNEYEETMGALQDVLTRLAQHQPKQKPKSYSLYETETAIIAAFQVPGLTKEQIKLFITDDTVEVKSPYNGRMSKRTVQLPQRIIISGTKATLGRGILRVEMPIRFQRKVKLEIEDAQ